MRDTLEQITAHVWNKRFFRFVVVGGINTCIDLCVFNLVLFLLTFDSFATELLFAKSVGFVVASVHSYVLNSMWTFGNGTKRGVGNYSVFISVSIIGLFLNMTTTFVLFLLLGNVLILHPLILAHIAFVGATLVSVFWNYYGYHVYVFKRI